MTTALTGKQKQYLRSLAHHLNPLVHIGKGGLNDGTIASLEQCLNDHELIKVKYLDHKDEKKEIAVRITELLHCDLVGSVGNIQTFYRESPDEDKQRIELP